MKEPRASQSAVIFSYYKSKPNQEIYHAEIVDWATKEWLRITGLPLRDPDRAIRKLGQEGHLVKVAKGIYKYDPSHAKKRKLEDFTPAQKQEILQRDDYKCVACGRGVADGVELQIDHIKAKDLDGKAAIDNGQTLCAQHNFQKKNYGQTEFGKKMFIRLYNSAKSADDSETMDFTSDVLEAYEKHGIDNQVIWKR